MDRQTNFSEMHLLADDAFRRRVIIVCSFIFLSNIPSTFVQVMISDDGYFFELIGGLFVGLTTFFALVCALISWHALLVTRLAFYVGTSAILLFWGASGGLTGHFTPTLVSLPLICALLFGSRDTIVFSVLLGVVVAGFYLFDGQLVALSVAPEDALLASSFTLSAVLLVVVMIVVFLARESERREARLEALLKERSYAATHDDLTNLCNRATVNAYLSKLDPGRNKVNIFMVDLDGFKDVNDSHGHDAGDTVLTEVANVLTKVAPEGALVARLGGDEFLVAAEVDADNPLAELKSIGLGDTLADALDLTLEFEGVRCAISGSVGSARFPADARTGKEVRRQADIALYRAKHMGKSRHARFHKTMLEKRHEEVLQASA